MTTEESDVIEGTVEGTIETAEKPARKRRERTVTVPDGLIVQQEPLEPDTPTTLVRLAVEQNFDIDKLEKLLQLQREWQKDEARRAFFGALSRFQSELQPICRSDKVDAGRAGKRRYASLGTINEAIRPYLYSNGLSFRFVQKQSPDGIAVTCIVSHRDGHSEETTLTAAADVTGGKNAIQSVGSTITYLERYTLTAALGLTTVEDDDDGEQGFTQSTPEERKQSALEMARAAALQGQAMQAQHGGPPMHTEPLPPPQAVAPPAEIPKTKPMITAKQMLEIIGSAEKPGLLRQLFATGDAAKEWMLEHYGTNSPVELTDAEADGVLSALLKIKHELDKPTPPPPAAPADVQTDGRATKAQRDRIKELTVQVYGDKAVENQAGWLRQYGYQSAGSLTPLQAAERIADLERIVCPKAPAEKPIPF